MLKERVLCGKCVALLRGAYKVVEFGRREKISCDNCGKRRYGCRCRIENIGKGAKPT